MLMLERKEYENMAGFSYICREIFEQCLMNFLPFYIRVYVMKKQNVGTEMEGMSKYRLILIQLSGII